MKPRRRFELNITEKICQIVLFSDLGISKLIALDAILLCDPVHVTYVII